MKTSNKILIGLLILIIAIPLIVTQVFKYKIAHGQSTADAVTPPVPQFIQKGNLTNYKAIKIISADTTANIDNEAQFTFTINYSEQPKYYFWTKEKTDSMEIRRSGDTLIFKYESKVEKDGRYRPNYLKLTISIPQWVPVIVDNSMLALSMQLDTQLVENTKSQAAIYLKNHSQLQLGGEKYLMKLDTAKSSPGNMAFSRDTADLPLQESVIMPSNMRIQAHNSKVNFHNPTFTDLHLNIAAGSALTINHGFSVKTLSGQIDPNAKIESNAEAIPKLAPIIK